MGIEEKCLKPHEGYSAFVHPWSFVWVASDHDLAEGVANMAKRICLLFSLCRIWDGKRRLDVDAFVCLVDYKVDFARHLGSGSVDYRVCGDHAHIYRIFAAHQFVEYDVFHEMGRLDLPEIEFGVSYAGVCRIVFKRAGEMLVPFDVVAFRFVDEKCIFKVGEILCYGDVVGLDLQGRGYRICKLCRVDETSDVAHGSIYKHGKKAVIFEVMPFHHVLKVDRPDEICKIVLLLGVRVEECAFWKASKCEVCVNDFLEFCRSLHQRVELGKGQRINLDYFASPSELGCNIARKKSGIGTGHIGVDIVSLEKSIEDMVERDVGFFTIFGAESRKVRIFGKYWFRMLDFVDQDKALGIVGGKSRTNLLPESDSIATKIEIIRLEVNFNDMIGGDAAFKQMLLEKFEEKETLATTAYANENLYQVVPFCLNKAIEQQLTLNYHGCTFRFVCMLTDLKLVALYQKQRQGSMADFRTDNTLTDLKAFRRMAGGGHRVNSAYDDFKEAA